MAVALNVFSALRLGTSRVAVRSINTARGRLSKKNESSKPKAQAQAEYVSPFPPERIEYGSLDKTELNLEKLYADYEETDIEEVPLANKKLPIILRPDTTLGFHGRDQHESLTRARGYSSDELERLTEMDRLRMTDFLHLSLPAIEESTDLLRPYCEPFQALAEGTAVKVVTRYIFDGNKKTHPLSPKVTLKVPLKTLGFDTASRARFLALVGPRYSSETDTVILNSLRFPTTAANKLFLTRQLQALVNEAKNPSTQESSSTTTTTAVAAADPAAPAPAAAQA